MASPLDPSLPPSNHLEVAEVNTLEDVNVRGTLPAALAGRLLGVHDGVVHSVRLCAGRVLSYRSHRIRPDAATGGTASDIFEFGGSIFAFGAASLAVELSEEIDTLRRVDLAGQSRRLFAKPKRDQTTGDLHLLAAGPDGFQAHVVVSSGAFTRRSRPLIDAPNQVKDFAITRDRVVFVADGFVGVTSRDMEARITWIATGIDAPALVLAYDAADTIVMLVLTPSLVRWATALDRPALGAAVVNHTVLDPAPRRSGRTNNRLLDGAPQFFWTTGDRTADTHDLATGSRARRSFDSGQPGDLVFVADPTRPHDAAGGWLVGFVHEESTGGTDLVVLDAAHIACPAIAVVRIPRRLPPELHTTWVPEINQ